jgi:hypothetical protein
MIAAFPADCFLDLSDSAERKTGKRRKSIRS